MDPLALKFLADFGYLPSGYDAAHGDPAVLSGAVSLAQQMYGLDPNGKLDAMTSRVLLRTPRCGHPDVQHAGATRLRWGKSHLRYTIESYPSGLGMNKAAVRDAIKRACASVSAVCGLTFEFIEPGSTRADLVFTTGRGQRAGFDGPSGTLAYAYLPNNDRFDGTLTLRFDLDEPWTDDARANGILLEYVACHELLHSLGMHHTSVPRQLMNAIYNRLIGMPQRGYDIEELVARYPASNRPSTPTPPAVQPGGDGATCQPIQKLELLLRVNGTQVHGPYEIDVSKQNVVSAMQPFSFN